MRRFDFSPYFRSSVGFDRVFDLLDSASRLGFSESWPPYDIVKTGDDRYQLALAVPGLSERDLSVAQEDRHLVIRGRPRNDAPAEGEYLHQGLGTGAFEQRFELADHIRVTTASLMDGVLRISLVRELPDRLKPRQIPIQSSALPRWSARKQLPAANTNGGGETRGWWSRLTGRAA